MNLRCMYCQTMFGMSREVMLIGLQTMESENLTHTDFYCPKCRRANRVERKKLELANPNWQQIVKKMVSDAKKAEQDLGQVDSPAKAAPKSKAATKKPAASAAKKKTAKTKASTAKKSTATKSKAKHAPKAKKKTAKAKPK
ncbi:MAG: hypothetical protein QGM50_08105 [Anaerolineae bacterium]|nr:hypothetical protein [Anaerolineae bacterium]MDK1081668.1 hypothetical protein [Anaerolineae bacterium]MDK1118738.1 hypothetical protein [Anaerolineae bacterium]